MAPRGKITRSTAQQLNQLVDYMSTNQDFAIGQFTGPLGAQRHEAEWAQLREHLSNYGPDKTVDQWRHTWRDLKKKARDDGGRVRLALNSTGNAVPIPELSERTQKILGIIGPECAVGIAVEQESGVGQVSVDIQAAISPAPFMAYDDQFHSQEVVIEIEEPASRSVADARAGAGAGPSRARTPRAPRSSRADTARPRARLTQPASAAFIAAQRNTNQILQDISNVLQQPRQSQGQEIWQIRHNRRAQRGAFHNFTFLK